MSVFVNDDDVSLMLLSVFVSDVTDVSVFVNDVTDVSVFVNDVTDVISVCQ